MSVFEMPAPKLAGGPYVMGVLNLTPDSFSDGGQWAEGGAVRHGLAMLEAGADIIDVGGESTRPGADAVDEREEIARVVPVIACLRAATKAPISIDTMKPAVALAAMQAGASIWNDVAALSAPGALETAASMQRPVILMHMQGAPRTMQDAPHYGDVVSEVIAYLKARVDAAAAKGVAEIWVDPGIGFGKTLAHNLALLRSVRRIADETGRLVLIGASRKRFIAAIDAKAARAGEDRLGGSIAAALLAAQQGAAMVRVHDVAETVQALKVWRAASP
ncbi:MAG TPA: dihydropteroate synthase [Terricaulis sp.]|nr:dihydropteroate synthase [Terricaulis sp.]